MWLNVMATATRMCHLAFSQLHTTYTPMKCRHLTLTLRPACFGDHFHMTKNPSLDPTLSFSLSLMFVWWWLMVWGFSVCSHAVGGVGGERFTEGVLAEWGSYWWWLINGLSGGRRPLAVSQYRVSSTGRRAWWALHLHAIPMECVTFSEYTFLKLRNTWFRTKN